MYETKKRTLWRRLGVLILALCLTLSLVPAFGGSADAAYYDAAMDQLMNWGVVKGYPDGQTHPERQLTRAEFVAMVNRAYGYNETGETPFIDVPETSWYADDISIAYNAGYFNGISPRMAGPENVLTREQTIVLLARNMRLDPVAGEVTEFTDGRDCADWSRGLIRAAAQRGIITGNGSGAYKPQNNITRGEMAVMLQRALGTLVNQPGTHTLSDTYGNVTISSPNTTLKDSTIAGDLYITGGLGLGDVTLENVRVLGDIIVAGGGESQSGESIILRNVEADSLLVDSIADQYVSLRAEGNTSIAETLLRSDAYVQDRTRPGDGLQTITLESPDPNAQFTLSGNLETVVNKTPGSTLTIAMGTVDELTIDEHARNSTLNLDVNSVASVLNLDTATNVTGVGDIAKLFVNTAGSTVEMLPDTITIRPGITANIAGEDLNAAQAQESSSDPRLLAGYPKIKNIAPTSATSYYSANKAGTVYWAVSTTTDGSIPEDELVDPTEGNTRIALNGNLPITSSNEEFTAALAQLVPDSNYYLSAVMVDARDRHSPVKVAAFTTPDNTVPAFAAGYPRVIQNTARRRLDENGNMILKENGDPEVIYTVQVGAMPNKSCQLYYALCRAGSTAPTGQQFRTGSLGDIILGYSGVEDVARNELWTKDFSGLDELTTYDLYLWLTDADGARSSAVQKLTFTTVDGTPPRFVTEPTVTRIAANSLTLTTSLNEAGTVYWVAVTSDTEYPKPNKDNKLDAEWVEVQLSNGMNGLRAGSVNVQANRDATINITGLTPETEYTIFYIARDASGNYSLITVESNKLIGNSLTESTLDTNPPTVSQEFTDYPAGEPTRPYTSTDIKIIFSENVLWAKAATGETARFIDLYRAANADDATAADKEAFRRALSSTILLYNAGASRSSPVTERKTGNEADWVIDYRNATVEQDGKQLVITFPTTDDTGKNSALNLKSGSTYYFEIRDIADTSSNKNLMGVTKLDNFTTVFAQVELIDENINYITYNNGTSDQSIRADIVYSMRPISTSSADANIDWDMIIWSDTSIKFDLYYRTIDADGTTGDWKLTQDDGEITIPSSYQDTYIGQSLHYRLDPPENPTDTLITKLKDDGTLYQYAIHIKELEESKEEDPSKDPDKWSKNVHFWINVVTAPTRSLRTLASRLIESNYKDLVTDTETVADITTPRPFIMNVPFTDNSPPEFYERYPLIVPTDTSVDFSALLTRKGTVYYVVAPVGDIITEKNNATVTQTTSGLPTWDGNGYRVGSIFTVDLPMPGRITSPNANWNSGSFDVQDSVVKHPITGLTASTDYFLYVVLSGESTDSMSKNVQLFHFRTKDAYRPNLWVQRPMTDTVTVTSLDMDSTVEYALFQMDRLSTTLLGYDFKNYAKPEFASIYGAEGSSANSEIYNYKVYEAIQYRPSSSTGTNYNSYFDEYATDDFKMLVLQLVNSTTSSDIYVGGTGGQPETILQGGGNARTIECAKEYADKFLSYDYYFIAVGRYAYAEADDLRGDSYSFRAISPVRRTSTETPKLLNISGTVTVDYTKTDANGNRPLVSGQITMAFDNNLYYRDTTSASASRPAIHLADSSGTSGGVSFRSVNSLAVGNSGLSFATSSDYEYKYTDQLILNMDALSGYITVSNRLSSQSSESLSSTLMLDVDLNASDSGTGTKRATCRLDGPSDIWKNGQNITVYTRVISTAVGVTSLTLDADALTLTNNTIVNGTAYAARLTATVNSDATDKTVTWSVADADVASISSTRTQSGTAITITGKKSGRTTITATAGGQTATCSITVQFAPTITLSESAVWLKVGETRELTITLNNYIGNTSFYFTPITGNGTIASPGLVSSPDTYNQSKVIIRANTTGQTTIAFRVECPGDNSINQLTSYTCTVNVTP